VLTDEISRCGFCVEDLSHQQKHLQLCPFYPYKKLFKAQKPAKFQRRSVLVIVQKTSKTANKCLETTTSDLWQGL